jgi:hypothetical protein
MLAEVFEAGRARLWESGDPAMRMLSRLMEPAAGFAPETASTRRDSGLG